MELVATRYPSGPNPAITAVATFETRSGDRGFALMNIRNVQLDNRPIEHLKSVENRNRGERKSCGVDDDALPYQSLRESSR